MTANDSSDPARKRSICIFSLSCVPDDPRVRRQGDTFHDAGWEVHAFGINEPKSELPPWAVHPGNWTPPSGAAESEGGDASHGSEAVGVEAERIGSHGGTSSAPVAGPEEEPAGRAARLAKRLRRILPSALYVGLRKTLVVMIRLYWRLRLWGARAKRAVLALPRYLARLIRLPFRVAYRMLRAVPAASSKLSHYTKRDYYREFAVFRHEYKQARRAAKNPESALDGYFQHQVIQQLYDAAKDIKADIYLANDWHTIPIALRLARENGGYLCYDTHEYALEEYLQHWTWRKSRLPIVRAVEGIGLSEAIVASTVSAGIGEDMARVYGLEKPLLEIRNVQNYRDVEYHPVRGEKIRVLYHGLIVKARGLEACVRSVRLWKDEFEFLMRGPVSDEYKAELIEIARQAGVEDRVKFLPPVPMLELITSAAAEADIGMSTPPKLSRHHIFALPNKFFEYIQAGLALCIADLPDMGRIVRQHELGLLIPEVEEQHIANTINAFTRESVNQFKRNSLKAAKELNWEVESQKLLTAYEAALAQRGR